MSSVYSVPRCIRLRPLACAVSTAILLSLGGCLSSNSSSSSEERPDVVALPPAPAGLGEVDTVEPRDATVPEGRTDVPPRRIHAAVDGSKRGAANDGINQIDPVTGYALNNAGYQSGSGDACYADETTNLSIRPLKGFLEIWEPATPYMDAHQTPMPASRVITREGLNIHCPAIPVASWTGLPGDSTDGRVLNEAVHEANLRYSGMVTSPSYRTADKVLAAYLDDARGKGFSVSTGLGPLASLWHQLARQQSYIDEIPTSGTCPDGNIGSYPFCSASGGEEYNLGEGASHDKAAAVANNPEFGLATNFMMRATNDGTASTNPTKYFYKYARPYRWSDAGLSPLPITVSPGLENARKVFENGASVADIRKDSDFPSGHTAEAVRGALAYGYLVPERFQEMLARGLELGDNRIVAGMHSALAVMGGRINGEIAALNLINRIPQAEREAAHAQAQASLREALVAATGDEYHASDEGFREYALSDAGRDYIGPFVAPYASHAENKEEYRRRLTFGFTQDLSRAGQPAVVPEGAETLLETRLPYLSGEQRRVVLKTTALDSGWPVLDDEEGFGRLNIFDAADGYGAFDGDVEVTMDASLGGFHAYDAWRNDIGGAGKLTKLGSGALTLTGENSFSGGLVVSAGTLVAAGADALGTGMVYLHEQGTLKVDADDRTVKVAADYVQTDEATLELVIGAAQEVALKVAGEAFINAASALKVTFEQTPASGQSIALIEAAALHGQFDRVELDGVTGAVHYEDGAVTLVIQ